MTIPSGFILGFVLAICFGKILGLKFNCLYELFFVFFTRKEKTLSLTLYFSANQDMDTLSSITIHTKNWIEAKKGKLKETSTDDLIVAWEKGVNKGLDLKEKIVQDFFRDKLSKALEAATQLLNSLNKHSLTTCNEAYFRVNNISDFEVLYFIDLNDYISEKRKAIYNLAIKTKERCKKEDFNFRFVFKPDSSKTNLECLIADGYNLKYVSKPRKT